MSKNAKLQSHFLPKKTQRPATGPVDIYARITLNGKRSEISTGECYDPEKWSTTADRPVNTNTEDAKMLVACLETVRRKIFASFQSMHNDGKEVSAKSIKSRYLGKDENHLYLVKIFEDHNNKVQEVAR